MAQSPTLTSSGTWTFTESGLSFRLTAALRVRHDATGTTLEQAWQCFETRAVRWIAVPDDHPPASLVRDANEAFGGTIDQEGVPVVASATGPDVG
jgi:hypothetical protein